MNGNECFHFYSVCAQMGFKCPAGNQATASDVTDHNQRERSKSVFKIVFGQEKPPRAIFRFWSQNKLSVELSMPSYTLVNRWKAMNIPD